MLGPGIGARAALLRVGSCPLAWVAGCGALAGLLVDGRGALAGRLVGRAATTIAALAGRLVRRGATGPCLGVGALA